jgi:hypothetical protein
MTSASSGISILGVNGNPIPYFEALSNFNSGVGEGNYARNLVE